MKYLSVCSGIEAATQAWHLLGWEPEGFSEIEPFPSVVLAHHYPQTPNLGDMTAYEKWNIGTIDLLVGGTPCQSFSVAGLRKGLGDPRGNLMLTFGAIAKQFKPRWVVWENVPGVLSSNGGRDFGTFLGMLAELGYGFAYRILDTQFVRTCRFRGAIPQRRRRVFVVGYIGDWRRAAAVLFDGESVRGNPPPSRKAGQGIARDAEGGAGSGCIFLDRAAFNQGVNAQYNPEIKEDAETSAALVAKGPHAVASTLQTTCNDYSRADDFNMVVHGTQDPCTSDGTAFALGRNTGQENAIAFERRFVRTTGGQPQQGVNGCLRADTNTGGGAPCVAFAFTTEQTPKFNADCALTLTKQSPTGGGQIQSLMTAMQVRRLTPVECERLQGFPDNFTRIPWRGKAAEDCPDGPRYKALGNSMSVNVMEWIGGRIERVESEVSL
jgi:DNA (cytosine-5)-methyltransferase 1